VTRDLHPTEGARYLLELASDDGAQATYRATIFTPAAAHATELALSDDGVATVGANDAPAELADRLANIAKVVARDAKKRRADGMPPWPARILRWRK
jgi:hypothetical protein